MQNKKVNWFPLLATNFFGVLNDNFLKKAVSFISIYWIAQGNENEIIAIAGALFIIPYLLLSPFSGFLAKIYLKRKIVVFAKIIEIPIMAIASIGFITNSIYFVMTAIFLMGLQSCIHSPAKYGLIRDTGGKEKISFGIGALEMLSFLGNLIGAVLAGYISDLTENRNAFIIGLFISFAVTGWITSKFIKPKESEPIKSQKENLNPIVFLYKSIKWSKSVKGLNFIILGLAFFWLAAAMIEMNLISHCPKALGMSNSHTGLVMAMVAVSVAIGSFLSGVLSNKKVELALVPIGGIGFALNISLIYLLEPSNTLFTVLIIMSAFFAGLYKIPLNAFLQERVEGRKLGDIILQEQLTIVGHLAMGIVHFYLTHGINITILEIIQ
jgi:acyl-[acyl-carrier-protein]-phospholipid O-acyltransferase/long-chain-fatty-acid--[acyl-carrier-protein] ligase